MSLFGIDNADGLELPFGLELIPGVHATQREIDFVYQVVGDYIRPSYKGRILLIGSRQQGRWIGRKSFGAASEGLSSQESSDWLQLLNEEARNRGMHRGQIPELEAHLGPQMPQQIRDFLLGNYGVPGSDIDLLLKDEPKHLRRQYSDWDTGQVVDIFSP